MKQEADITCMCASIFIKILFLQSKAICKILQKNIIRKYAYDESIILSLLKIINRNTQRCYYILLNKIKDNQININENDCDSQKYVYYQVNAFKIDVNSIELKQYSQEFQQICYESVLYYLCTIKSYNIPINKKYLEFVEIMSHVSARTIKCMFLQIQLKISICRIYIEQGDISKADKQTNIIVESILILFDRIMKRYQIQPNQKQTNKYKYYFKKAYKLMMIISAIIVRIKMVLNQEKLATHAIKIFYYQFYKCATQIPHFQKYLKPQVYLYGQYCQYQSQKSQIASLIQILFKDSIQKLSNSEIHIKQNIFCIKQKKHELIDFYNKKMAQFHKQMQKSKTQNKLKRLKNCKNSLQNGSIDSYSTQLQNSSIKQTKQTKIKNISFGLSSLSGFDKNKKRNSLISQTDFYKPIFKQINEMNSALLTNRKKQGTFYNANLSMNALLSQNNQKNKKAKGNPIYIVNNKKANKNSIDDQKPIQDVQKKEKLQQEEYFFSKQLKYRKQKLKEKANTKFYRSIIQNNILNDQQNILTFRIPNNQKKLQSPRIDSSKQIQHVKRSSIGSGNKIRQNLKHMLGKKSKIQQFMDLLIQNKQYLGIKRLGQKIEYLKKKEELKQKFRSTRKTTSIHYQKEQFSNFAFLAEDIIKFSLEDSEEKEENIDAKEKSKINKTQCLTNDNNFKIGEKSILILMKKLEKQKQSYLLKKSLMKKNISNIIPDQKFNQVSNSQRTKIKRKASQWKCKFVL